MKHPARAAVVLALLVLSLCVRAQAPSSDSIIVTATRTAQTADETLAAVTVLTREDIERRQARSLDDLLRDEAGITISNSGGAGKVTDVFLRGTESSHVLVLIDGVKTGSPTLGLAEFQDIPLEQIERIEIVRGPRSSLYGSEAIGGVIQIFTRRGGGATTPAFSAGAGSHRSYNTAAGVSGGGERAWFNAYASGLGTQGINACRGQAGVGGCFTNEPDKDGYWNNSGSLRFGYKISDTSDVDVHWLRMQGRNEFDGDFQNRTKFIQEVYGARYRVAPTAWWQTTFLVGRSRDDGDNFKDAAFSSRFNSTRNVATWQNDFSIDAHQIVTLGVDYQIDRIESTTAFPVTARDNRALFALYQAKFDRNSFEASARTDDNEQFGTHDTGGIAWGYRFDGDWRLRASYGTAFKAPTFNDLFFPGFGNPNLRPETSRSTEVGVNGAAGVAHWAVNVFQTDVDDLIGFDPTTFAPVNVDVARIRGLEGTLATRVAGWNVNAQATLLDPRNRSNGPNNGKILNRRAREALQFDASRTVGAYRYGALVRAEGPRFDDIANTQRLGGYATVDLLGEYTLAKNWRAQARIANLFDKQYETAQFFNQPGREFFATIRYQPTKP